MDVAAACSGKAPSRAELRRQTLKDTARKLFIANGFHATGMAQIARESGIAIGQIYRDFQSKEDIVVALVQADCGRVMQYRALDHAIATRDEAAVRAWLRHVVEPTDEPDDARMFTESLAECSRNARMAAVFTQLQDELYGRIMAALALLVPGEPPAARRAVLAEAIMAISIGLLQQQLMRPGLDSEGLAAALNAMIGREIAALEAEG